ncbi:hypothetical protein [Ketobacter sp.]
MSIQRIKGNDLVLASGQPVIQVIVINPPLRGIVAMDLQDDEAQQLYFNEVVPLGVEELMRSASEQFSPASAESCLLKAYEMAPNSLTVLVALYRFYYDQRRYLDAIHIASKAMTEVAPLISFPDHWSEITFNDLANGVMSSFSLVRFYLLALKACAYLHLQINQISEAVRMLNKVVELDIQDRLGAKLMLQSLGPVVVVDNANVTARSS